MGPQLDSCGRGMPMHAAPPLLRASMGPQLDSCGRDDGSPCDRCEADQLQWGRNLTVAEGGRVLGAGRGWYRFNGAAT